MTSGPASGEDRRERWRAVQALGAAGELPAAERLLSSLGDADWHVRQAAADALAIRGGNEAIGAVLRAVQESHHDLGFLNSAIRVLAESGIDVIEPLTRFLDHPDAQLRMAAALTLGDRHDGRAIPALLRALEDADLNVRFHAIEALGKLRAGQAVGRLVALAESRDFSLTAPALEALAAIGDGSIASRLTSLLDDELFQPVALDALGRLGGEEVVPELSRLLDSAAAPTGDIARALVTLHDRLQATQGRGEVVARQVASAVTPAGIETLLAAASEKSGCRLEVLAAVLSWIEDPRVLPALIRLLNLPAVRWKAIDALVHKGRQATALLIEQLAADDLETRHAAVVALGRIRDARSVPALVTIAGSNFDFAVAAIEALGLIRDERAQGPLVGLLGHRDAPVRDAAISALCSLELPALANNLPRLLADTNPLVRESAAKIAGSGGYGACGELLLECCRDVCEAVRWAAFDALSCLDDPRVLPVLAEVMRGASAASRAAGVRALTRINTFAARPLLILALDDSDPWVRYFAARAVGRRQVTESLETLTRLAEFDDSMQVRIAAVDAIGQIGTASTGLLVRLAAGPDPDLSRAAAIALGLAARPKALAQIATFPSREEDC